MTRRLPWPASLRPWRRWIIALLILIVLRAVLPPVLRSVIASQASKALRARVEVGDVDLALYKLGVALKDVAVYAASAPADGGAASGGPTPSATTAPTADASAAHAEAAPAEDPLIAWKRFEVSVRWLPLFKKAVILRDIELDTPHIDVDRLADGKLNLMALVPASGEEAAPTPPPVETKPEGSGWGIGVDHLIVHDGVVRFRDFKMKNSEPIALNIPTVEVTDVYLIPGQYGEPSKASITVAVDKGSLQLEATLVQISATENQLEAYLKARNLPVRRARLYIPNVGWSVLEGGLDADITYNFDTGTQNAVRGSATVNDFAVRVANLDEPALGWKSFTVNIDPVDLLAQRAVVSAVDLNGATLLVRPSGGDLLPFLAAVGGDREAAPVAQNAAPPAAEAAAAPPASVPTPAGEAAPPWRWAVSSVHIGDTRVRVLGTAAPFDIGVGLDLTDLADQADQPAHIALALTAGQGTVNVDGGVRVAPPGFGGTLKIAGLSIPELGAAAGALPKDLLQTAQLGSDLTIEAGLVASKEGGALSPTDVRVQGKLSLADVRLTPPSPPGVSVGVHAVELAFAELQVPGVLPAAPNTASPGAEGLSPGDVHARAKLSLGDLNVSTAEPQGYTLGLRSFDLDLTDLFARGAVPVQHGSEPVAASTGAGALSPGDVHARAKLSLGDLNIGAAGPQGATVGLRSLNLDLTDLFARGAVPVRHGSESVAAATGAGSPSPGDVQASAKLSLGDLSVGAAGPQGYTFGLRSFDLDLTELLARGAIPVQPGAEPAAAPSGDVKVGGRLRFADLHLAGAEAKTFAVGARAFELPFQEIALPGVLARGAPAEAVRPMHVALGDVHLNAPSVRITRTAEGLALPNFSGAPPGATATAPPAEAPEPTGTPAAAPPPPRVEVTVDSFRLTDGNVAMVDRTVKPFYEGSFSQMSIDVSKLRWPDLAIGNLRLAATGAEKGKLDVYGALAPTGGWLQVYVDQLALVPLNPYATTFSGYSIGKGKVSVVSKVSAANATYDASNYVTLHNLDLRGGAGESMFQKNFGIPLSTALALMRDTDGNIGLDIPVTMDKEGTQVGIGTVIRGALQRAIMGALVSPLKMVGAAFSGDKIESVAPPAIQFLTGRAEFTADGAEQVAQLAALLASRPGIGVTLDTTVTPADVRWMREQALREEWAGQGMLAKLKDLPDRGARKRVEKALDERAHDGEGKLEAEDAAMLDHWLDERPPITAERLRALADARLAQVEDALRAEHGIERNRVARREAPTDVPSDASAVRVELGPAGAPVAQAAP